jgi:hypothetical protein
MSAPVRRYAPKGYRPIRSQVVHLWQHAFVAQVIDPRSCQRCNLPRSNGRHG